MFLARDIAANDVILVPQSREGFNIPRMEIYVDRGIERRAEEEAL